jgi:hypothetical protein
VAAVVGAVVVFLIAQQLAGIAQRIGEAPLVPYLIIALVAIGLAGVAVYTVYAAGRATVSDVRGRAAS